MHSMSSFFRSLTALPKAVSLRRNIFGFSHQKRSRPRGDIQCEWLDFFGCALRLQGNDFNLIEFFRFITLLDSLTEARWQLIFAFYHDLMARSGLWRLQWI